MQKIAMLLNNVVENIAVWDGVSLWQPEGYILLNVTDQPQVDMGDLYHADTGLFTPATDAAP